MGGRVPAKAFPGTADQQAEERAIRTAKGLADKHDRMVALGGPCAPLYHANNCSTALGDAFAMLSACMAICV